MNEITGVTRRNIFDSIVVEKIMWNGRLEEPNFLARIFDLSKMESTDSRFSDAYGDIWQHRVNNYDWDDSWVFTDGRFNLLHCDDSIFLQFLCEMLHPIVQHDISVVIKLQQLFNDHLEADGYEIVEKSRISDRPVFSARQIFEGEKRSNKNREEIKKYLNSDYVTKKITLMESAIKSSPEVAIGTAKELIETTCKSILKQQNISYDKNWDVPKFVKETNKVLKMIPEDLPDPDKGEASLRKILGSLSTVIQGITEIRNQYGSGHGKEDDFKGLKPKHARLVVGAASVLVLFYLECNGENPELIEE